MSTVAERVRVEAPRRKPKPKGAARRRTVTGGVLWIVVLGALLAGVVAVNVVVLQLNVRLDELNHKRGELKAETARLRSQISTAAANVRIDREAREGLGLVPAEIGSTEYVELKP